MTAMIAVGQSHPYHGGIYPTHVLWLSENDRPGWVLRPTGHDAHGFATAEYEEKERPTWATDEVVWMPHGPDSILEDGLLLIACRVLCDEAVLTLAETKAPEMPTANRVELEKVDPGLLAELRDLAARSELAYKLVVTVLGGSSLEAQLPLLERYPMQIEVCTVTYSKTWGGFVGRDQAEAHGSLSASWSPEGSAPERYGAASFPSTLPGSLTSTQDAIDDIQSEPVGVEPPTPTGVDHVLNELRRGPMTIEGPGEGWVVQGLISEPDGYVHLEVLDPVYWGNGPALPDEHLEIARELGFEPAEGMWVLEVPGATEQDLLRAAQVLDTYMKRAWS